MGTISTRGLLTGGSAAALVLGLVASGTVAYGGRDGVIGTRARSPGT